MPRNRQAKQWNKLESSEANTYVTQMVFHISGERIVVT